MVRWMENQLMQMLNVKQVAQRVGVSERAIWKWTRAGQFPQPIRISRSVRWSEAALEAWIIEQTEAAERKAVK